MKRKKWVWPRVETRVEKGVNDSNDLGVERAKDAVVFLNPLESGEGGWISRIGMGLES